MINLDTRLLKEVDQNEFWLLVHLAKRIDSERICWPSNKTLCKDLDWSIDKLQTTKNKLVQKGLLTIEPRLTESGQSSNNYQIKTDLISIFVGVDKFIFEDTEKTNRGKDTVKSTMTPGENTVGSPPGKTNNEVLTIEVLTNEVLSKDLVVFNYFSEVRKNYGFNGKLIASNSRMKLIKARIKEFSTDDCLRVIDFKFQEWSGNAEMRKYLTPDTIFRASNFPKYIEAYKNAPIKDWTDQKNIINRNVNGFPKQHEQNWPG